MIFLKRTLTTAAAACLVFLLFNNTAAAHDFLKDPLKDRYKLKSVSCAACHPGSNKAINNAFGMKFKTAFKGKDYTARVYKAKDLKKKDKDAGEKALKGIGVEMVAQFEQVIAEVEKESITFGDMLTAGLLNGTKLEKDVIAEMGKAQGVTEKKKK